MATDGFPSTRPNGKNSGQNAASKTQIAKVKATTDTMIKAAQLRAAGGTFREIGEALQIDPTYARTLVLRALEQAPYEAADLMRTQEGQRLDRLQRGHWAAAVAGDVKASTVVLRIMDQRAHLFGLNHADGIAERQAVVAEQQGRLMLKGLLWFLDEMGLAKDTHAQGKVTEMMRMITERDVIDVDIVDE